MEGQSSSPHNNNGTTATDVDVKVDSTAATTPPLPPPPGRNNDMYIVQFPKDQVYRVPPRENAMIVERYRNPPPTEKKKRNGCCCCGCRRRVLLTVALILVAIVAVIGITLATLFFIFNPKGPTFSVTNVVVKSPGTKNSPPQYEVSLKAKNPNKRLGIVYENSEVFLLFEDTKVATGMFPRLKQDPDASTVVKVGLNGANGALPKKMAKSMDKDDGGEKSDTGVELDLDMKLRVRIAAGGIDTWVMKSNVVCRVKVSSLGNDARVLSQDCDTNFKQY